MCLTFFTNICLTHFKYVFNVFYKYMLKILDVEDIKRLWAKTTEVIECITASLASSNTCFTCNKKVFNGPQICI